MKCCKNILKTDGDEDLTVSKRGKVQTDWLLHQREIVSLDESKTVKIWWRKVKNCCPQGDRREKQILILPEKNSRQMISPSPEMETNNNICLGNSPLSPEETEHHCQKWRGQLTEQSGS